MLATAGAAVGSRAPREEVLGEILEQIRAVIPFEAMHVSLVDPFDGGHRTLVNHGYSERIIAYVDGDYSVRDPGYASVLRDRRPVRMRDTDFDYRASYSFVEYWGPAGYGDGMTTPLFAADGRYVGLANTSTATEDILTDDVRDFMGLLSGVLGAMVDPLADVDAWLAESTPARRMLVRADGAVMERPEHGTPTPDVPRDVVVGVASSLRASALIVREGLVADPSGRLARIQLMQTRSPRLSHEPVVLATLRDAGPLALTLRETEVLTRLVGGGSNREIADDLQIAPRTVATHVEHLLQKLEVETRTAAAARAIEQGLVRLDLAS